MAATLWVLLTAAPALVALPPLDRDESRFAQAAAQMLETNDFIDIRYQTEPRDRKPIGAYWLQAASVKLLSKVQDRAIWAYRVPSILGAILATTACAWGAAAFFGRRAGVLAGAMLGASVLLSSEASIAKTDAVLCGAVTLSMAALGRLYGAAGVEQTTGTRTKVLFWSGLAIATLDKGPIGPATAGLAIIGLCAIDRRVDWAKRLGWGWGAIAMLAVLGPWSAAITVATDGGFWSHGVGGDIASKMVGSDQRHGAPPGFYIALAPLLFFPSTFLLPAAAVTAWRDRREPGVRFALAWLVPIWILFELAPTKLAHYTLPTYGALAWLAAAALARAGQPALGKASRWTGGALSVLAVVLLSGGVALAASRYGARIDAPWAALCAGLILITGAAGAWTVWSGRYARGLLVSLGIGVLAHAVATGVLAPRLSALWVSRRVAERVARDGLDPRNGVTTGPVAVVGYAEPSLIFALGTGTELDNAVDGADSVSDGQPAIVEQREDAAFRAALAAEKVAARPVDRVTGFDDSIGKPVTLTIWRSLAPPPAEETGAGAH